MGNPNLDLLKTFGESITIFAIITDINKKLSFKKIDYRKEYETLGKIGYGNFGFVLRKR